VAPLHERRLDGNDANQMNWMQIPAQSCVASIGIDWLGLALALECFDISICGLLIGKLFVLLLPDSLVFQFHGAW